MRSLRGFLVGVALAFCVAPIAQQITYSLGALAFKSQAAVSADISGLGTGVATLLSGTSSGSGGPAGTTSPTFVTPALGTPASGVATNLTGTAAGLTAGSVTTNANLTGPITSTGNATAVATQTGTGSTFVMQASPTLTTPNLGTPSAATLTNATGLPLTGLTGLGTGVATLLGGASSGSGGPAGTTSPAFTTPDIGAATGTTAALASSVNGNALSGEKNVNTGSAANAQIYAANDGSTGLVRLVALGTSFTTSGANVQDGGVIECGANLSGGCSQVAQVSPYRIYVGGAATGNLVEQISTTTHTFSDTLTINNGIIGSGTGFQHARATTGSIAGNANADVTLTWAGTFADTNYTVECDVLEATNNGVSLNMDHVISQATGNVHVLVKNGNAITAKTGTVHCVGVHD